MYMYILKLQLQFLFHENLRLLYQPQTNFLSSVLHVQQICLYFFSQYRHHQSFCFGFDPLVLTLILVQLCTFLGKCSDSMVSGPVPRSSSLASSLSGDIVLCFWALTVPFSTQEYKWVSANCSGNLTAEPVSSKASLKFIFFLKAPSSEFSVTFHGDLH